MNIDCCRRYSEPSSELKRLIPLFTEIMRDHQSHDVLLFCPDCHKTGNLYDLALRQELAVMCNAPIGSEENVKVKEDHQLRKVKSAGRALLKDHEGHHKIPTSRRQDLEKILKDYYEVQDVTAEVMAKGANLESM